jgi:hypothetical protein
VVTDLDAQVAQDTNDFGHNPYRGEQYKAFLIPGVYELIAARRVRK